VLLPIQQEPCRTAIAGNDKADSGLSLFLQAESSMARIVEIGSRRSGL
jgi:hypothetical protein